MEHSRQLDNEDASRQRNIDAANQNILHARRIELKNLDYNRVSQNQDHAMNMANFQYINDGTTNVYSSSNGKNSSDRNTQLNPKTPNVSKDVLKEILNKDTLKEILAPMLQEILFQREAEADHDEED